MEQNLNLHRATLEDLPLLGKIRAASILAQPETFWTNAEKQAAANFWQQMDIQTDFTSHHTYIYSHQSEVAGFVSWKESYFAYLFVLPEFQSLGIGGKLITFAEENIRKSHDHIWLWAHPYSEIFYQKNGFKKQPETEALFGQQLHKFLKVF